MYKGSPLNKETQVQGSHFARTDGWENAQARMKLAPRNAKAEITDQAMVEIFKVKLTSYALRLWFWLRQLQWTPLCYLLISQSSIFVLHKGCTTTTHI